MRRFRRSRGLGCLGCLPLGGLIVTLIPLILIGAVIYWLVSRQKTSASSNTAPFAATPPAAPPPPGAPGGGFCSHCGKPMNPGEKFCANCGGGAG
jgi:hypothetical protein